MQVKRLLEHELSRHDGMKDLIGEDDPGRSRRKVKGLLGRLILKVHVAFSKIMQLSHEVVVFTASRFGKAQHMQKHGLTRPQGAGPWQEAPGIIFEGLSYAPGSWHLSGMDIRKDPQQPKSLSGV